MVRNALSILCYVSFYRLNAQFTLTGRLTDKQEQPIEYAEVSIKNINDSTKMMTTLTNKTGNFSLSIPKGVYLLSVNYLGQNLLKKNVSVVGNINIGTLKVNTANQIGEVTVTGKKPLIERKIDRLVFNVENSISASGGDALDALKVTPGIRVQNDEITMIGKSGLSVMVDDRLIRLSGEDLTNYLQSLSAEDIKSIEVITTPPAKYEAEGNSGLINIILKKAKKNSWSNTTRSRFIQTTYPAFGLGNTFNYRKNRLSLSANVSGRKKNYNQKENGIIYYPDRLWKLDNDMKRTQDYISGRLGVDYEVSKASSIGFLYQRNARYPDNKNHTINDIFNLDNSPKSQTISTGNNEVKNTNHVLNVHYIQQLDTLGKKLSADIDYFTYKQTQGYNFDSHTVLPNDTKKTDTLSVFNSNSQQIDNYSAKVDISYPIKWAKVSYGAKAVFTETNNEVNYFDQTTGTRVLDPLQSDVFDYKENVQAVYADITKSLGKKWETKLGLRVEYTQTKGIPEKGEPFKRHYTKFFPTAYVLYKAAENHSINLNYSRRIKRPAFWELNPARFYLNASSYAEGNPFLQPSFTDNIAFTHTYKNKLSSTLYLSITSDGFGQVPIVNPENNIQVYTRRNYYTAYIYGCSENYTLNPFAWWQSQNQGQLYYIKSRFNKENHLEAPPQNGTTFYLSTNNTFILNQRKTLKAEVNFWYNFPQRVFLYKSSESYNLSIGIKMSLLKDKLQGSVMINDIFKSSQGDFTTFTSGIKQVYNSNPDTRYIRIGLTYHFGNNKIKVREHEGSNREERRRVN